jgi:hypothetical protein
VHVVIAWWDLEGSPQTIESLRDYLRDESVDAFGRVAGLRLKLWIADPESARWGVIMLWESAEAAKQPLPTRAAALIGYPATSRWEFALEAAVEGKFEEAALSRIGRAFTVAKRPGWD